MRRLYALCRDGWQLAFLLGVLWYGLAGTGGWHFGIVVVLLSVLVSRLLVPMRQPNFSLSGLTRFILYFLWSSLLGGIDVAWRAIDPRRPVDVVNHRHNFRLPPGQGRTVFIATVSLLPGTLSRSLDDNHLLVHSIAGDKRNELAMLEERVAGLFGLSMES